MQDRIKIRPATAEELEEVNWVNRNRGKTSRRGTDLDEQYNELKQALDSGLGVGVADLGSTSEGLFTLPTSLRNRARLEGIELQTASTDSRGTNGPREVKVFIRRYDPAEED